MDSVSDNHVLAGVAFVSVCVLIGLGAFFLGQDNQETSIQSSYEGNSVSVDTSLESEQPELSYQEELKSNGQVDGRSKNYWSTDNEGNEDHEFGGAVIGMDYADFRDRLMFAGFQPDRINPKTICETEPDNFECDYEYPETESCSGTGEGFCNYLWSKGDDSYIILTREGEGGEVVEMRFNR